MVEISRHTLQLQPFTRVFSYIGLPWFGPPLTFKPRRAHVSVPDLASGPCLYVDPVWQTHTCQDRISTDSQSTTITLTLEQALACVARPTGYVSRQAQAIAPCAATLAHAFGASIVQLLAEHMFLSIPVLTPGFDKQGDCII